MHSATFVHLLICGNYMNNLVVVPIDQRFAQLIQQFGLTKNSFAMSLGKTASVVQHLIDGRNKPGYDLLCKVFEIYPNVSRDWLLLGRGPMLVSGGPAPKHEVPAPTPTAEQQSLEPINMSDIEVPHHRRAGPGVAGTRLQPTEIAATLALAAAATQQARTTSLASAPLPAAEQMSAVSDDLDSALAAVTVSPVAAPLPVPSSIPQAPVVPVPQVAVAAPAPVIAPAPAPAAPAVPAPAPAPETSVVAALNAQYLQHQLALAELRNQHLQEQQLMLREMLAMARQESRI